MRLVRMWRRDWEGVKREERSTTRLTLAAVDSAIAVAVVHTDSHSCCSGDTALNHAHCRLSGKVPVHCLHPPGQMRVDQPLPHPVSPPQRALAAQELRNSSAVVI